MTDTLMKLSCSKCGGTDLRVEMFSIARYHVDGWGDSAFEMDQNVDYEPLASGTTYCESCEHQDRTADFEPVA